MLDDSPADERMDGFISVFNGHINNADKRAREAMTAQELASLQSIEQKGDGIMAIFQQTPTPATSRYVELVTAFVNEQGAESMAKMPVIDTDSGKQVGETEIPDDVIEAAVKVERWLREQPTGMELHGVTLAD